MFGFQASAMYIYGLISLKPIALTTTYTLIPELWWQGHDPVTKCKLMCLIHSKAKQTKTLEFRAEEGLL